MKITLHPAYSFCQQGRRDYQEDCRFPDLDYVESYQRFFLVCDGVGGSEKGEVASKTVCMAFDKALRQFDFNEDFSIESFRHVLDVAYDALDRIALRGGSMDMGTTLTFICFHAGGCMMAHIGDSRIYHIRPQMGILYRSSDHSYVNSLVHNGIITPEEAIDHPQSNIIERCMEPVEEDQRRCMATVMQTKDINAGDYFILCSDGVLHQMTDDDLVKIISDTEKNEKTKVDEIAKLSKDSSDNNTAWIISVKDVAFEVNEFPESSSTGNSDHSTKRITIPKHDQVEIESVSSSKSHPIMRWIKRIFN